MRRKVHLSQKVFLCQEVCYLLCMGYASSCSQSLMSFGTHSIRIFTDEEAEARSFEPFLKHIELSPTSWPRHCWFSLSETLFPRSSQGQPFIRFRCVLEYHLLREAFPALKIKERAHHCPAANSVGFLFWQVSLLETKPTFVYCLSLQLECKLRESEELAQFTTSFPAKKQSLAHSRC